MSQYIENPQEPLKMQKAIGYRITPHLHTSAEIIYIEDGYAKLVLGSLEYSLQRGDFAYIMPSTLHSIIPGTLDTAIYVVNAKKELIADVLKRYEGSKPASPVLRSIDVPRDLPYALASLASEENDIIACSWLNLVCTLLCTKLRFTAYAEGASSDLASKILAFIGEHYREPLSLETLANAVGVSRFHLSHMFASKFGIGFKEYLNNLRIECAKGLLRTTDLPISDIFDQAGFENQRTFNRVFNECTGISPREYRLGKSEIVKSPAPKLEIATEPTIFVNTARPVSDNSPNGRVSVVKTKFIRLADDRDARLGSSNITVKKPQKSEETPRETVGSVSKAEVKTPTRRSAESKPEAKAPGSPLDTQKKPVRKRTGTAVWLL